MHAKVIQFLLPALVVVALDGPASAWTGVTVGGDLPLGTESFDAATGTWTIEGDGHDIWGNADGFHFVYKYLVGDGSLTARMVEWGPGSNGWAKAGVMMRESLAAGSVHAMSVVTGGNGGGGSFQRRTASDGGSSSSSDPNPTVSPPWYVRVTRTGDEFRGYFSQDGENWNQLGPPVTIPMRTAAGMKAGCYIGLCVTSHVAGTLRTATFDSVVVEGEVYDAPPAQLEAYGPTPVDGATGVLTPLFEWNAGDTAILHKIYLGTDPDLTEADVVAPQHPLQVYFHGPGLVPGATYYWRVDEFDLLGGTHAGPVWTFTAAPLTAFEPIPADGAKYQALETELVWQAGVNAISHDLYFSEVAQDVIDGAAAAFQGNLTDTNFDPGGLALDTTHYWRVDEIDVSGVRQVGPVWSFSTVVPGLGAIKREIWEDIGGTNLNALRNDPRFPHAPTVEDELPSFDSPSYGDTYGGRLHGWLHVPVAGRYTFWVAGDDNTELYLGAGPETAELIASVPSWSGARAWDSMPSQKSPPISLEAGRYYIAGLWKEGGGGDHCAAAWQGPGVPQRAVIAGTYLKPFEAVWAFDPEPANGAADITQTPVLKWTAGVRATQHDVYFGEDPEAVATATPATPGIYRGRKPIDAVDYEPGSLEWDRTYYWRVDEVNDLHPESPWIGPLWSFTTADFLVIDPFEAYTDDMDAGEAIFQTWIDGVDAGNGSVVGYFDPPFAEQSIVYAGNQSMPFEYNNVDSPWLSEASRTWATPQDWTVNGAKALTLYFRGYPQAYVETAPDAITISAAGADIWNAADEFRYAYRTLDGDGSIIARIEELGDTHVWAKAGLMIRSSVDPGARFAAVYMTGNNGVRFQARTIMGDDAVSDSSVATPEQIELREPVWLRLDRTGEEFSAFYSHDPDAEGWTPMVWNPQTVSMTGPVLIGLAVTSHSSGNATVAAFSGIATEGASEGPWEVAEVGVDHPDNTPEPLYVALEDEAGTVGVVQHPDPQAVLLDTWQEWNIALSEFAALGVDLASIEVMHLGVGDRMAPQPGGGGLIYIDEIRVHKPRCVPSEAQPQGDLNGDCLVDHLDLVILARSWLEASVDDVVPAADLSGDGRVSLPDYSGLTEHWLDEVLWP